MINKEILKKQIIYRSSHRGTKEMDIFLGNFVKRYIEELNDNDLKDLDQILILEDEILYQWYFNKKDNEKIPKNKVSSMLEKFKI